MSSSPCPTSWLPWPCRTRLGFTVCFFGPQPRPYFRSPLIPNTSALRSGFWRSCILGARRSCIIPICIASSRVEDSRPISGVGFPVDTSSFCPSKYSVLSFAESFSTLSNELLKNTSLLLPVNSLLFNPQQSSPLCYAPPRIATGSFMPSDPLPGDMVPVRAVITSTLPRGFGVEIRTSWLLEYDLELQSSKSVLLRRSDLSWQSPVGIRSGTVVANNAICHFINPLERVPESSFSHRHFNPADLLLSTNQLSGIITRFDLPKT